MRKNSIEELKDTLANCYVVVGVEVDQLPYSLDIDQIVNMYHQQTGDYLSPSTAFQRLLNLRKSGDLPTLKPHNKLDELYVAAGCIPARFCKLWISSEIAIYKGQIEWYRPVKGEFVGTCDLATSACHIVKEHNDALLEAWALYDAWAKRWNDAARDRTPSNERSS